MPDFKWIGSGVSEPQVAENDHLPLTWHIALTTVYALTCYTVKTYQFKTHCKGDSHNSNTANIILPGLAIKQRWTILHLQAKWYRYSNSLHCALCWLKQLISPKMNSLPVLYFACRRKVVHLCFITSPGKMMFAVLKLWLSPLQWVLNW